MRWNLVLVAFCLSFVTMSGCLGFGDDDSTEPCEEHAHDDGATESHGDCEAPDTDDCAEPHGIAEGEPNGNSTASDEPLVNDTMLRSITFQPEDNETLPEGDTDPSVQSGMMESDCPEEEPTGNGTANPPADNELPTAVLTMKDGEGNVLGPNSFILPGQNITFSAIGSSDPDGQIDLIGLTIVDANATRNTQLMSGGKFVDALYKFDHVGAVNVTLRVLDDRGEGVVLNSMAYVNGATQGTGSIDGTFPLDDASSCDSPDSSNSGQTLTEDYHWHEVAFNVNQGATWISAVETAGGHEIALCDKDGALIVAGEDAIESEAMSFAPGVGYYLVVIGSGSYDATVTVHYEPKA